MSQPHVVFVLGDHEYSGEETLPLLATELEKNYGMATTVCKSYPDQNAEENIPGLEALGAADLGVFCMRWRRLPDEQLAHIDAYVKSGKPVMGFRTASHSFKYPEGHPQESWNAWAQPTFGAPPGWGNGHTHYGHQASTDVEIIDAAADHPILNGVAKKFHVRSWLYHVLPMSPPDDGAALLMGTAVEPNKPAEPNPVAWTWVNGYGGRAFFTTLGHPEDFAEESVVRLTTNAVQWCLDAPAPYAWAGMFKMDVPYRGMVRD